MLFGEHQWADEARSLFVRCMPFAEIIETSALRWAINEAGGNSLANLAMQAWWVMKTCVAFFSDPREFCMMDDDVFVLASVQGAGQCVRYRRSGLPSGFGSWRRLY
jgi:hypothetical protein